MHQEILSESKALMADNLGSDDELSSNYQLASLKKLFRSIKKIITEKFFELQQTDLEKDEILILLKIREEYLRVRQSLQRRPITLKLNEQSELLRRISKLEIKALQAKLNTFTVTEAEENIELLLNAINCEGWEKNSVIHHKNMPYYALIATQSGYITTYQFATLMLYWSAAQLSGKITSHNLILNKPISFSSAIASCLQFFGNQPALALGFLKLSLRQFHQQETAPVISAELIQRHLTGAGLRFTAKEYDRFIKIMKKMPQSEQRFFIVPNLESYTIVNILNDFFDFSMIGKLDEKSSLVLSCGMRQAYLEAQFSHQAVTIKPVLGLSSVEDIRMNGLTNTRDMAIHFPGISLPGKADLANAPLSHFSDHDTFHAAQASGVPVEERELFIETGDTVKEYFEEKYDRFVAKAGIRFFSKDILTNIYQYFAEEAAIGDKIFEFFVDMDFSIYRLDRLSIGQECDLAAKYWITVSNTFFTSKLLNAASQLTNETKEEIFARIYELADKRDRTKSPSLDFNNEIQFLSQNLQSKEVSESKTATFLMQSQIAELKEMAKLWRQINIRTSLQKLGSLSDQDQKSLINQQIVPYFSVRNISSVFEYGCQHRIKPLQLKSMIFMSQNLTRLAEHPNFKTMRKRNWPKKTAKFIKQLRGSRFFKAAFTSAIDQAVNFYSSKSAFALLTSPENINILDVAGFTALDYAIELNRVDIVSILLNYRGADPNPQKDSKAMPSLFSAMYQANLLICKIILKKGFDLRVTFQGDNLVQFYLKLLDDPKTFSGVLKKYRAGGALGEDALLYRDALWAKRNMKIEKVDLSELDIKKGQKKYSAKENRLLLAFMMADMSWSCCRRLPAECPLPPTLQPH